MAPLSGASEGTRGTGRKPLDVDAGLRLPRGPHADARLRADARGGDGGVREELAAGVGRVLINAQIAAGGALTLRLRHHWYLITSTSAYGCSKNAACRVNYRGACFMRANRNPHTSFAAASDCAKNAYDATVRQLR